MVASPKSQVLVAYKRPPRAHFFTTAIPLHLEGTPTPVMALTVKFSQRQHSLHHPSPSGDAHYASHGWLCASQISAPNQISGKHSEISNMGQLCNVGVGVRPSQASGLPGNEDQSHSGGRCGGWRPQQLEEMATEISQVAPKETLIMEPVPVNSSDMDVRVLTKSMSKTQLRQRIPFAADEEVTRSVTGDHSQYNHGGIESSQLDVHNDKASGKSKFWGHGFHYRKISNATDDGVGSHGFLPGLMKKAGFGSQEFKEKDIQASEHTSGMPRSRSHGFLPGLIKRAGFGSQEFKEFLCHSAKNLTEIHPHHQPHSHHHGTRDKEIFGFEDAGVHDRDHENLFGIRDMEYQENVERADTMFGFEDTEFERGQKGRDLFGSDDPDTLSFRRGLEILGPLEADAEEIDKTRHVFGDENAEDSDDDEYLQDYAAATLEPAHQHSSDAEDDRAHEKAVHHENKVEVGVKLMNNLGELFSKKWVVKKGSRRSTSPKRQEYVF
ncbi:hypothetical protein KC19_7G066500 [Ceratodon purpureus]|uniref:Uncharacterized protein n=1 Tax=Ceratodon purpureus TaxID=3225 RepID=A0A8T0H7Y3_CERPU|nr:hypothetical protein KC19_7G066500 [Ceratodon purpureus]